ncbi:hypothetical protein FACS1894133_2200 [Clostridia bacterium]|nr:hypothetical protein FACS1894133_2200 [Clostridia bacterium]
MLKIRTKLVSSAVAFAVAVTAVFGTAITASAVSVESYTGGSMFRAQQSQNFAPGISSFIVSAHPVSATDSGDSRYYGGNPGDLLFVWGRINNAKYAVYYTYVDNATGRVAPWTIKTAENPPTPTVGYNMQPGLVVANPVGNATYYVTILTYTDTPSRQYGGFSEYGISHT